MQRRAARWTVNNFEQKASVTEMVKNLGWRALEQRMADARLFFFFTKLFMASSLYLSRTIYNTVIEYLDTVTP